MAPQQNHEHEDPNNIVGICADCSKKMYPMKGKFKQATVKRAKLAKFCFIDLDLLREHMWVRITSVKNGWVTGTLDNEPIGYFPMKYGDTVRMPVKEAEELMF